jgi:hypothetical protein
MAATATSDYALSWGILKWPSLGDFGWPPGIERLRESGVPEETLIKAASEVGKFDG